MEVLKQFTKFHDKVRSIVITVGKLEIGDV